MKKPHWHGRLWRVGGIYHPCKDAAPYGLISPHGKRGPMHPCLHLSHHYSPSDTADLVKMLQKLQDYLQLGPLATDSRQNNWHFSSRRTQYLNAGQKCRSAQMCSEKAHAINPGPLLAQTVQTMDYSQATRCQYFYLWLAIGTLLEVKKKKAWCTYRLDSKKQFRELSGVWGRWTSKQTSGNRSIRSGGITREIMEGKTMHRQHCCAPNLFLDRQQPKGHIRSPLAFLGNNHFFLFSFLSTLTLPATKRAQALPCWISSKVPQSLASLCAQQWYTTWKVHNQGLEVCPSIHPQ